VVYPPYPHQLIERFQMMRENYHPNRSKFSIKGRQNSILRSPTPPSKRHHERSDEDDIRHPPEY
jgi:hypothetical protein